MSDSRSVTTQESGQSGDRLTAAVAELVDALRAELASAAAPAPDRLFDVDEAAAALSIGRSRLYSEISAGRIRTVQVGRRRLVPASAIEAFIADRRAGG